MNTARMRRVGANLAAGAVGAIAAYATWHHIVHVGQKYGESAAIALPIAIDGMMIAGVLMAADAKAAGRPVGPWSRVATWVGAILSIAAQIESGRERGWVAALIATVFSITLIITVEAVTWQRKSKSADAPLSMPVAPNSAPVEVHPVAAVLAEPSIAPVSPAPAGRPSWAPTLVPSPVSPQRRTTYRNAARQPIPSVLNKEN